MPVWDLGVQGQVRGLFCIHLALSVELILANSVS